MLREYDLATVCKWIGNSPSVAAKHYATSVDLNADFQRATGRTPQAKQKAQQSAAISDVQPMTLQGSANDKTPENQGFVDACQMLASADTAGGWARQDSNL